MYVENKVIGMNLNYAFDKMKWEQKKWNRVHYKSKVILVESDD